MDILFKNVTAVTMNRDEPILNDVCIGVKNGKIEYIGLYDDKIIAKRTIDGSKKIMMPGLINTHTHTPMTMLRGYANDLKLEEWLFEHIIPAELKMSDEMVKTGAEIAVAEMISSGTISYTDMYFNVDEIAAVAEKSGIKANLSNAVITPEGKPYKLKDDNSYIETLRVLNDYDGSCGGRIKADASIHAVYTSCPEAWQAVAEFASSKKMRMHVHLSETRVEQENCLKKYGRTPAEMFDAHHVFDVPTLAAHTVWISDSDIEILAKRGVSAAHNPVSNLLLASGIAPVSKMLAAGINVSLGTDGMASNNSHDLFEEIKLASILQKYATNDASALPALEALIMATANGAKAQGRENETGRIAAGLDADLILIDLDSPRQTACYNPVYNLAYSTTGRDVCMTMCQGRILYENGDYKTVDIEKLLFEAREHVKNFI